MEPFIPENLPPEDLDLRSLMPLAGKANLALGMLNGLFYGIPNPNLLLSPLTIQEAVLSSKIEGTQADLQDVLKYEAGETGVAESIGQDIQEIMNYRRGLELSQDLLKEKPFCLNTLLKLHEVLMSSVRGANKNPGAFRTSQNWIGATHSKQEHAAFVPPSPVGLQEHLNKWEAYWHSDSPDSVVQLALIHAQFEILHPFNDGNGRLGRMIIPLFFFEKGILSRPSFYLSAFFESNRDEYIQRLRDLGNPGSWTRWTHFFLTGVAEQADSNTKKARAILDLYERLSKQALQYTKSRFAVSMVDFVFERPIFRASDVTTLEGNPSRPTVQKLLEDLKNCGILKQLRAATGPRPQLLACPELLTLCEGKPVV